jgi:hypothetical protein
MQIYIIIANGILQFQTASADIRTTLQKWRESEASKLPIREVQVALFEQRDTGAGE